MLGTKQILEREDLYIMKHTVLTLQEQKKNNDKITMLTAYDYTTAKLIDEANF